MTTIRVAQEGSKNILFFLLEQGLAMRFVASDNRFHQPLTIAAQNGHEEIVRLFLAYPGADLALPLGDYNALLEACRAKNGDESGNYSRTVKLLLDDGRADPSYQGCHALKYSSENGDNHEIVKLLLADPRVNPGSRGSDSLRYASEMGRSKTVALLLQDKRVDPSAQNNQAIVKAVSGGHTEVVRLLLEDSRTIMGDKEFQYILLDASELGYTKIIELLQDARSHERISLLS